ncbi:MAG: hypothetical protein ACRD0P_16930 [Stackebrandtia sp.]
MNRLLTTTIGIAAVALALTACGAEDPASESKDGPTDTATESEGGGIAEGDFRNAPVPDADPKDAWEKDLPAEPDSSAPLGDQIEFELTSAAAEYAHQYDDKAEVGCPDVKGDKDTDITCEMTYFDQKIEWDVAISGGSMVARYEYESDERVMSREFLENALRFKDKTEDVMCELDKDYTVVNPEKTEPVVCHSLKDGEQTNWELSVGGRGDVTFSQK